MRILTLDDMETRAVFMRRWFIGHEHTHVTTAPDAIRELRSPGWDLVMLDHDLAEEHYLTASEGLSEVWQPGMDKYEPGTGMDVVDFLLKLKEVGADGLPKMIIVHSYNPSRAPVMYARLKEAGFNVHRIPFNSQVCPVKLGY